MLMKFSSTESEVRIKNVTFNAVSIISGSLLYVTAYSSVWVDGVDIISCKLKNEPALMCTISGTLFINQLRITGSKFRDVTSAITLSSRGPIVIVQNSLFQGNTVHLGLPFDFEESEKFCTPEITSSVFGRQLPMVGRCYFGKCVCHLANVVLQTNPILRVSPLLLMFALCCFAISKSCHENILPIHEQHFFGEQLSYLFSCCCRFWRFWQHVVLWECCISQE